MYPLHGGALPAPVQLVVGPLPDRRELPPRVLCINIYIYIYMCVIYIYIYIYICIQIYTNMYRLYVLHALHGLHDPLGLREELPHLPLRGHGVCQEPALDVGRDGLARRGGGALALHLLEEGVLLLERLDLADHGLGAPDEVVGRRDDPGRLPGVPDHGDALAVHLRSY